MAGRNLVHQGSLGLSMTAVMLVPYFMHGNCENGCSNHEQPQMITAAEENIDRRVKTYLFFEPPEHSHPVGKQAETKRVVLHSVSVHNSCRYNI